MGPLAPDSNDFPYGLMTEDETPTRRIETVRVAILSRLGSELGAARLQEVASRIAERRLSAAAVGFSLSRMGRPTTRMSAPERIASPGVPTRF